MNTKTCHKTIGTHTPEFNMRKDITHKEFNTDVDTKPQPLQIVVRTGIGTVGWECGFSDEVARIHRVPNFHKGWQSITYQGNRYQLFGGGRTPYFICLNNPIQKRK